MPILGSGLITHSSSFNVLTLSGLLAWYDAQDAATVYTDSGLTALATANGTDTVGGWKDKSGNNSHALQATSGKRPIYFNNAIGGKNAIKADGVDDFLGTSSIAHGIGTGDFYIACVLNRHTTQTGYRDAVALASGNPGVYVRNDTTDKLTSYLGSKRQFDTALALSTNYVVELWRSSSSLFAAVNAAQEATSFGSVTTSIATSIYALFASSSATEFAAIYLAEVIITKTMPTSRAAVAAYLKSRYGI